MHAICPNISTIASTLTKGLSKNIFEFLVSKLGMIDIYTPTLGGCCYKALLLGSKYLAPLLKKNILIPFPFFVISQLSFVLIRIVSNLYQYHYRYLTSFQDLFLLLLQFGFENQLCFYSMSGIHLVLCRRMKTIVSVFLTMIFTI